MLNGRSIVIWTLTLGTLAAISWSIVFAVGQHQKGVYAGFQFNDGKNYASAVMADHFSRGKKNNFGWDIIKKMRLGTPAVVNTHIDGLLQNGQQVRIYHIVGAKGVHWCVSVWDGGYKFASDFSIQRGCKFGVGAASG